MLQCIDLHAPVEHVRVRRVAPQRPRFRSVTAPRKEPCGGTAKPLALLPFPLSEQKPKNQAVKETVEVRMQKRIARLLKKSSRGLPGSDFRRPLEGPCSRILACTAQGQVSQTSDARGACRQHSHADTLEAPPLSYLINYRNGRHCTPAKKCNPLRSRQLCTKVASALAKAACSSTKPKRLSARRSSVCSALLSPLASP